MWQLHSPTCCPDVGSGQGSATLACKALIGNTASQAQPGHTESERIWWAAQIPTQIWVGLNPGSFTALRSASCTLRRQCGECQWPGHLYTPRKSLHGGWPTACPLKHIPLTLAQASFSWMAVLLGSTWRANLRLLMVYSWPQYTLWGKSQTRERWRDSLIPPQTLQRWAWRALGWASDTQGDIP